MNRILLICALIGGILLCPVVSVQANKHNSLHIDRAVDRYEKTSSSLAPNPVVQAFALSPSCTNGVPNNDGYLQISAASDATHYNFSSGNTYSGSSDINDATSFDPLTDLPLQFGTLTNPSGSQDYTIRIFNNISSCFTDITVNLQEQDCSVGCDCTEYIYLNEVSPASGGQIHKFAIALNGNVTEVGGANGIPWYASDNEPTDDKMPSPHGLGVDTNGRLYIGETIIGDIRKLDCSGNIFPTNEFEVGTGGFNISSLGNIIYVRRTGFDTPIEAYNTCTGLQEGFVSPPSTGGSWGFHIDKITNTFYNLGLNGPLSVFQPTATDFTAGASFPATITTDVTNPNPVVGDIGVLPEGNLGGVTTDAQGFIYIVRQQPCGRIYKYHPDTYELVAISVADCASDGAGFAAPRGIVYSSDCDCLFVSSISATDDCLVRFSTDLATWTTAVGPVPSGEQAKGVAINKECCPTNNRQTVNQTYCVAGGNEQLYLNELFPCSGGIICEVQWMATDAASMNIFESCDQSIQSNLPVGCYSFTRSSDGLNGKLCGAFEQTFNLEILDIGAVSVSGDQTFACGNVQPAPLSVSTTSSGSVQWQVSTLSCFAGFTDIPGATGTTYQPPIINETSFYRAIINEPGGCSSNECNFESDCITITVQASQPGFTAFALSPSCTNGVPNNDGFLQISAATNATHYDYTPGNSYTGSGFGNATAFNPLVDLPLQFGTLANPSGSQEYTIRVFNGAACFTDVTVSLQEQDCSVGCDCKEYIYLNEPLIGAVLKFEIDPSTVLLNEVIQANGGTAPSQHWYPGTGVSELPSPHGLAADLNGNFFIGSSVLPNTPVRKFSCDGTIAPIDANTINNPYVLTNIFSIGNTLYTTRSGGPASFDLCTGTELGTMCFNDNSGTALPFVNDGNAVNVNWGLSYNPQTQLVYATGQGLPRQGVWVYSKAQLDAGMQGGACIDPLIWRSNTVTLTDINVGDNFLPSNIRQLNGVVGDNDGNIYLAGWLEDAGNPSFLLKYNSAGEFQESAALNPALSLSRGVVWSENTNRIYVANQTDNPSVDCISAFDAASLAYLGAAAPNPNLPDDNSAKALSILKECCPTNNRQTIDQTYCIAGGNEKLFLNELFPCSEGVICEAQWSPTDAASLAIYESCDQSIQANLPEGCYSFTRSSDGLRGKLCGAFEQTFNLEIIDVGTVSISGNQTVCEGSLPSPLLLTTSTTGTIQWQSSTTSCTDGFTDIPGANSSTYQPPALSQTTFYKAVINEGGNCATGNCNIESDCISVSVTSVSANETMEACNDNGTPVDTSDDYITFSLSPTINTTGSTYSLSVDNGGSVCTAAGMSASGLNYGTTTDFRLQNGSADGLTNYTITLTDSGSGACTATTMVLQNSCFTCINPTFSLSTNAGTCNGAMSNNDAMINLSGIANATEANISVGTSYSGPAYGSGTNVNLSGNTATFSDLMHSTSYTVRVFNGSNTCFTDQTITTSDITCTLFYSLGNRVFYDDDISGAQNGSEAGIDGVQLQLLNADGSVFDSEPATPGVQVLTVTTANGGYYRFDDIPEGDYIVEILPATFTSGGLLENYSSTNGAAQEADPNSDLDLDDNGLDTPIAGSVRSGVISLAGTEPTGESEPTSYSPGSFTGTPAADTENNLTVDFGFYRQRDRPDFEDPLQNPCPNEPCHFISNDIHLGSGVTNDPMSTGSSSADSDMDDGLIWGENVNASPGGVLNLPVILYNNTGNDAYFRIWVDWNGDGDFEDMNEQVADEFYLAAVYNGTFQINYPVNIPTAASQNQDLALRLRFSTDNTGSDTPCGSGTCAADGEIEDFLLRIRCSNTICLPVSLSVN